jgi:hypothetical protein
MAIKIVLASMVLLLPLPSFTMSPTTAANVLPLSGRKQEKMPGVKVLLE